MKGVTMNKLKVLVNKAKAAFARVTIDVRRMADAYVEALKCSDDAQSSFSAAFPMFGDREWRRLKLIGEGRLLPQFMMKSDRFVCSLIKMPCSMNWQKAIVGASRDGRIRVDRGRGPEKVNLSELTRSEDLSLLAMLVSEADEKLPPEQIVSKYKRMMWNINRRKACASPRFVIMDDCLIVNRPCRINKDDIRRIVASVFKDEISEIDGLKLSHDVRSRLANIIDRIAGKRLEV
jgi:hypothetical protein